ncbi:MAG: sulfite exporter TauE/SafE family protein [Candidatus Woesearchaeota archaeon]
MELLILSLIFTVSLGVSFLAHMIGGGGALVTVPMFIFLGLPANAAVATHKFGALGGAASALYNFKRAGKIEYRYVIPVTLISIIGSYIGARILIDVDEQLLSKTVAIILLMILPFIFVKNLGLKRKTVSRKRMMIGYICVFALTIYGGFFGGGVGILNMFVFIFLFGLTYVESNATIKIPWAVSLLVALVVLALHGLIHIIYGLVMLVGTLIGGYLGSNFAIKKGERFVRVAFSVFVVISAIKLLFF